MFATGPARARLVEALLEAARRGPPNIPPLPELFQHFRRELGAEVYGSMGIAREDKEGRAVAVMRNFEFFRAPRGRDCLHAPGPRSGLRLGSVTRSLSTYTRFLSKHPVQDTYGVVETRESSVLRNKPAICN